MGDLVNEIILSHILFRGKLFAEKVLGFSSRKVLVRELSDLQLLDRVAADPYCLKDSRGRSVVLGG